MKVERFMMKLCADAIFSYPPKQQNNFVSNNSITASVTCVHNGKADVPSQVGPVSYEASKMPLPDFGLSSLLMTE